MKTADKTNNANNWLKQNGINPLLLNNLDIELLQAQKIAHNLLKHHTKHLNQHQTMILNDFLNKMAFGKQRQSITRSQCFSVMNIGTKINRRIFKKYRRLN
jgi:hypothetical protein